MEMVPGLSRGFRVESGLGLVGRVEVGQAQCHGEEQGEQLRPGGWGGVSGAVRDLPGVCTWCSVQSYWVSLPTDSSAVVTTALYISPPLYPSHLSQTPHLQCQQATLFYKVKNFHNLIFDFFFFQSNCWLYYLGEERRCSLQTEADRYSHSTWHYNQFLDSHVLFVWPRLTAPTKHLYTLRNDTHFTLFVIIMSEIAGPVAV